MKQQLNWQVGHMNAADLHPKQWMPSSVPGSVQQDYARYYNWEPYYKGVNFRNYGWMEDVYWIYRAPLRFTLKDDQIATLIFKGIDYRYEIRVGNELLCAGEGMFSPVSCDVTSFSGVDVNVDVLIFPCPKADDSGKRDQARYSCKSDACYGWDWHPRLISAGLWDDAYLLIHDQHGVTNMDISYRLNDQLDHCEIFATAYTAADGLLRMQVLHGDDVVVVTDGKSINGRCDFDVTIHNPKLWYPIDYGEQNLYTIRVIALDEQGKGIEEFTRRVGLRRSRLVMNTGAWRVPVFPKSRAAAPATLEINGVRVFAKGSNWVNAQVFPGDMTEMHYRDLLTKAKDANMNIVRIWGGGFINKECFFDLCDEMGIMVWQEFPLACNEYPDDDSYLSILEKEATAIIRRLRKHPSVVLWCGGNELFNSWSGMTEQHHALRLLDSVCYREDRFTPFMMTSPLNGMGHGGYVNFDEKTGEEFITTVVNSNNTAYTEFGCPSMSSREELLSFMREEDLQDCEPTNDIWVAHHGFGAWLEDTWVRKGEVKHYFGGYCDIDDLIEKTQFIQAMCYKSCFEEMRRQWPMCSMAINWCWNEPWPTAANNSLIHWSGKPKPAYQSVKESLRSRMASLRVCKHLWWDGEQFQGEVWMLNDTLTTLPSGSAKVSYSLGNEAFADCGIFCFRELEPQTNLCCGAISFCIPKEFSGSVRIRLDVADHPEMNSEYTYLCRCEKNNSTSGILNI